MWGTKFPYSTLAWCAALGKDRRWEGSGAPPPAREVSNLVGASPSTYARPLGHPCTPNKVIPEPFMLPNHDQCCVYFPTVLHGLLGRGNSLYTEYKQSKALGEALVTK